MYIPTREDYVVMIISVAMVSMLVLGFGSLAWITTAIDNNVNYTSSVQDQVDQIKIQIEIINNHWEQKNDDDIDIFSRSFVR